MAVPPFKGVAHSGHFLAWKRKFKNKSIKSKVFFFIRSSIKKNNSELVNISSFLMRKKKREKSLYFFSPINQEFKSPRINISLTPRNFTLQKPQLPENIP